MCRCCSGNFVDGASFGCGKCGATHLDANKFATKLHTCHMCSVCNHCWMKQPAGIGNPLAALGCSLDRGVLYVSRVPVSAGEPHVVSRQRYMMCVHVGPARIEGSCKVAACGPAVEAMVHTSPGQ